MKTSIDILKMSAGLHGSYSLSANQLGMGMAFFGLYKDIPYGHWMIDEVAKRNN